MALLDFTKEFLRSVARDAIDNFAVSQGISKTQGSANRIGGKSIEEWDREWISIGMLKTADLSPYSHYVGLYRHVINGRTMYVGRAIEWNNGGFRKRLSDYRRESNSARTHTSGRLIHEHLDEIRTYLLIVGSDAEAAEVTKQLEGRFIAKYGSPWNKMLK